MARKVFFSFHYEDDVWRASVIRNSGTVRAEADERGFIDAAEWEKLKQEGNAAVERWIKAQLDNTTVTVVLIGAKTSTRPWVKHELIESYRRGNGLLGIRIHNIKDTDKLTAARGETNFGVLAKNELGRDVYLTDVAKVYDWILDDGYSNFSAWVEAAAKARGK